MSKSGRILCLAVVVFGLLLPSWAWGQAIPEDRRPPALVVQVEGRHEPLRITQVKVETQIRGYLSETRMTLTFFNPNPRPLAGDLYFPLPEGATISGYALDIEGAMLDGVVVEKHEGRRVFEKIVRRGIDPGLMEWVKGNNFKTRVFPIPARGTRTVMVRYLSDLVEDSTGAAAYLLPLRFKDPVEEFSLRVEVVKPTAPPEVRQGALANFTFGPWRDSFVAETTIRNQALNQDLIIALPDVARQKVLVEKAPQGGIYFCLHDRPQIPPVPAPKADRITLYWDASGSRGQAGHDREFKILEQFLAKLGPKVTVDLILFRHQAEAARSFVIENGRSEALLTALKAVDYDGGTQMAAISPRPEAPTPDFYLLFTDGLSNFGKEEPTGFQRPVFVLSADASANHAFLRRLADQTGGDYFNLARLDDQAVLSRLGVAPFVFLSAESDQAEVIGLHPQTTRPVHGRFTLAGKLRGDKARIVVSYGYKGRVVSKAEYTVSAAEAVSGGLVRLLYAQKKIEDLEPSPKKNKAELLAVGQEFGLVTPGASLIVLDNLNQYVEHRILPPESKPAWREEYLVRIKQLEAQAQRKEEDKIKSVLAMWEKRVDWWQREFTYPPDFKYTPPQVKADARPARQGRGGDRLGAAVESASPRMAEMMARAMPASPPPAPGMAMAKSVGGAGGPGTPPPPPPPEPSIDIKPWDPQTPYLDKLKAAPAQDRYKVYLEQKKTFGASPAFYLDCADFLFREKQADLALQVLSNVAELKLDDPALLRILAHRLAQQNYLELSRLIFEEVLDLRPEEPQSFRDLAVVLDKLNEYQKAVDLFNKVVMNRWDRFPEIEVIALMELNRTVARAKRAGVTEFKVDKRLLKLLDLDVRIVLTWDSDMTDMDLWVVEPSGEKAFYGHRLTTIGGLVSRDVTDGYGPEEYVLKKAMRGKYQIQVNYYGQRNPALAGPVTLQVEVFANYGRETEKRSAITLRLKQAKEVITVGEVGF